MTMDEKGKKEVGGEVTECTCTTIHEEVVELVRGQLLPFALRETVADFFKIMGDTTRVSILNALCVEEMCVCDISALLGMTQSAISHQLKTLRQARLVSYRRDGKTVYYSLNDEHIRQIINLGLIHVSEK